MPDLYEIPFRRMDGTTTSLAEHRDDVVLVVNVASRCGLAPQYATLETLQGKYRDRGFTVIGFPSNQFLQELGSNTAIAEFCSTTYGVTFPVVDRIRVNGRRTHPLFEALKKTPDAEGHSGRIRWNFEKFLVLPGGEVRRYSPRTLPDDPVIVEEIEAHLPR
ncbi:glutathione peroxidase [Xylanimonas oleitrophica]|uniref:Glutathione peroxidase n=1 Tax=Xylanimonas oleitrophica TaxID=2607479 RepID=A0A2W5WUS5_9MICO|nr:glutathione peroxidase [Xylanimonas oleitrophica]PZR54900.1 glutathione peroxidase [Xylanimonas oleitrophica]